VPEAAWEMAPVPNLKCLLVREQPAGPASVLACGPGAVAGILRAVYRGADRESFAVLLLDQKNHVLGINQVSLGTLTQTCVHPREVFRPAIVAPCATIILAHNHLSGDPSPSAEDEKVTKRLIEVGALVGIPVLDHVIVACRTEAWFSFRDARPELFSGQSVYRE